MNVFSIIFLVIISIGVLSIIYFLFYRNKWIQDDILNIPIQQKVNRKLLKNEIKKLNNTDIYNLFVVYDDLEMFIPKSKNVEDIININRKNDKPLDIRYNNYTRSYHICHKNHYKKVIAKNERRD